MWFKLLMIWNNVYKCRSTRWGHVRRGLTTTGSMAGTELKVGIKRAAASSVPPCLQMCGASSRSPKVKHTSASTMARPVVVKGCSGGGRHASTDEWKPAGRPNQASTLRRSSRLCRHFRIQRGPADTNTTHAHQLISVSLQICSPLCLSLRRI